MLQSLLAYQQWQVHVHVLRPMQGFPGGQLHTIRWFIFSCRQNSPVDPKGIEVGQSRDTAPSLCRNPPWWAPLLLLCCSTM